MANQNILLALEQYTGDAESLTNFVTVATSELGPEWMNTIYDNMADVAPEVRARLDDAYNYYAAVTAWNEIQTYLTQTTPLDYERVLERVPVLEHWLAFLGGAGEDAVSQLQERLRVEGAQANYNTAVLDDPFKVGPASAPTQMTASAGRQSSAVVTPESSEPVMPEQVSQPEPMTMSEMINEMPQVREPVQPEAEVIVETETPVSEQIIESVSAPQPAEEIISPVAISQPSEPTISPVSESQLQEINPSPVAEPQPVDAMPVRMSDTVPDTASQTYEPSAEQFNPLPAAEPAMDGTPLQHQSESAWRVDKIFRQLDFIENVQGWISVRCLELGYTDFYTYRYFGFLVDVLDRTIEELDAILQDTTLYDLIEAHKLNGIQFLQNRLLAYQQQSKEAHESANADLSPLPREDLSVDDLRDRLGGMDTSLEKEYLGPAPDGFEVLDDPYENMDEKRLTEEYEKIEAGTTLDNTVAPDQSQPPQKSVEVAKNTSQTPQNGVQRRMSFSFGAKQPQKPGTGGTGE